MRLPLRTAAGEGGSQPDEFRQVGESGRLGVGVIGYGYAGEVIHAPLIEGVPELDLVAVSTSRADRKELAQSRGYAVHPDAAGILSDERVDLVVIATPHDTHLSLTQAACGAGKHVVCDKLMALNVDQAQAMANAAKEAGVVLSVFHNRRWDGDFLAVLSALSGEGASVGELIRIRSWVHSAGRSNPARWRAKRAHGGGIFSDWGAHLVDQTLLLHSGRTKSVYCTMHFTDPAIDVESGALCVIEFDDGSTHVIETNQMYHQASKGYECWGTEGLLRITGFDPREDILNQQVKGIDRRGQGYSAELLRNGESIPVKSPGPGDWRAYYQNVADHILEGAELRVTQESVIRMMRLREAALASAQDGRVIDVSL